MTHVPALVFATSPNDRYRAGRTVRALRRLGLEARDICGPTANVRAELRGAAGSVWLVRAGAWPARSGPVEWPWPSDTGLPLMALGAVLPPSPAAPAWSDLLAETGGDFANGPDLAARLPEVMSAYLEPSLVADLVSHVERGECLTEALRALAGGRARVVRYAPLDVHHDPALRVVQLVTTLQQGGAERVALDLARGLEGYGVRTLLVTLGRPTRAAFAVPPGTLDLSGAGGGREGRMDAVARAVRSFAADLVHGHLLDGDDVAALAARDVPLVLTVHNVRQGWPRGLESLHAGDARLLIACAQAVEADLRAVGLPISVRTAWNGINFGPLVRTPESLDARQAWRRRLGFGNDDFVLLALANPRPQKRLERLPAILAAVRAELRQLGCARAVRLVVGGSASAGSEAALRSEALLVQEIDRLGLGADVRRVGAVDDVAALLTAADVLISASAHEGLSLAHLEALAAGLPVVATDAGGTSEIARDNPAFQVVPLEAGPQEFGRVLAGIAKASPPDGRSAAAKHFTLTRMVERHLQLYPRAVEAGRGRRRGDGLLLVCNNFSTGGAQSSARRLLIGLSAQGVRVRAAVLQEQAEYPTPGRTALGAAGIEVLTLPPSGTVDPVRAVAELLEWLDADPPRAVVFWNAIMEYKVLLADALLDVPVFDVSPGGMYFTSLDLYFARPRPGLPYRRGTEYGARLAGVIVKYRAEAERAACVLGAPVHVIPNGVVLGPRPVRRPPGDRLVLGTAARLSPQKKLEELLAALRLATGRLPPHVLRIAGGADGGDTAYVEQLKRCADSLAVEWVGEVEDTRPFLADLDLFAMVSEPAGCPNASLEAMAAGLPVVATDVGGAAEQVEDGVTGLLVPSGDVAALADALVEACRDSERLLRWGSAGRARAEERFDADRMVADYRRLLLPKND
jgi:glycosyltransferase involved in cell wall biosynthesis